MAMRVIDKLGARQRAFMGERPVCVAFLGDSVTHGCFEVFINERGDVDTVCRAGDAYPAKLGRALGGMFPFAQPVIVNAGASGDNAFNGLKRLERDALSFSPDLVIVNFGLNDSMNPDVSAGLSVYAASMREIFSKVKAARAECMLVTPSHMCTYVSRSLDSGLRSIAREASDVMNSGVLGRYADAARECAREAGVYVADAYNVWNALARAGVDTTGMLSNHINHPSPEAHDIFVAEILREMLA